MGKNADVVCLEEGGGRGEKWGAEMEDAEWRDASLPQPGTEPSRPRWWSERCSVPSFENIPPASIGHWQGGDCLWHPISASSRHQISLSGCRRVHAACHCAVTVVTTPAPQEHGTPPRACASPLISASRR